MENKQTNKQTDFANHGDTISRQAAIDALTHKWDGMVTSVFDVINSLPSAQPDLDSAYTEGYTQAEAKYRAMIDEQSTVEERKTGKWIKIGIIEDAYDIYGIKTWASKFRCNKCGFITMAIEGHIEQYEYCPHCGVRLLQEGKDNGQTD